LRKGWRTAPFQREEVQAPFQAAAEVVTVVRARLDEQKGDGVVLRQLEGSAMNFLWGWAPSRPPCSSREALVEFFRGLVFATLSDGRGLVEGLDDATVEHYVSSHPIIAIAEATLAPAPAAEAAAPTPDAGAAAEAAEALATAAAEEGVAQAPSQEQRRPEEPLAAADGDAPAPSTAEGCGRPSSQDDLVPAAAQGSGPPRG